MNITRITVMLALGAALVASAQAKSEMADTSAKGEAAVATVAGADPADQGTGIKLDEASAQRHLGEPRSSKVRVSRPNVRIVAIDPLLPLGE